MQHTNRQQITETDTSRSRKGLHVTLAAAAIIALVFSPAGDQGFFAIVFAGPIVTGIAARLLEVPWKLAAAPWAISGIFFFAYDGVINNEDMAFHAVLTLMMIALVALGGLIGRPLRRLHTRSKTVRA